jgi:predicted O-methyltransferase YrrM
VLDTQRALHAIKAAPAEPGPAFDFITDFKCGELMLRQWQIKSEFLELLSLLDRLQPRTLVEIGTGRGGTLFFLARAATDDATLVSVDLEGAEFGGGYKEAYGRLLRSFARDRQRIELVRGDSHDPILQQGVRDLVGGRVDFLLIDGDHTYEGVSADLAAYGPLVRPGGLIALHDVVPGPEYAVGGVPRLWQELQATREVRTIVESWEQGGYGIGLLDQP